MIKPGDAAPDFELEDHRGETIRLADFAGRRVILWFYPKAETPGCTKEGCAFRDAHAEFDHEGIEILGISFDSPDANRKFAEKHQFRFRLLSDIDRTVGVAYGAADSEDAGYARRVSFLIGTDGRVEHVWDAVEPQGHAQDVLATARDA